MIAINSLLREHRLIERMISVSVKKIEMMRLHNEIDMKFIDEFFDFIKEYANGTHRSKEEEILFKDLEKKPLSPNHIKIMRELLEDHIFERTIVNKLNDVYNQIMKTNTDHTEDLIKFMVEIADFYPKHIQKEDNEFFIPIMNYYTEEEQIRMYHTFEKFDEPSIHEKYIKLVETLEN